MILRLSTFHCRLVGVVQVIVTSIIVTMFVVVVIIAEVDKELLINKPMSDLCPQPPLLCHNRVAQYTFDESNVLDDNTFSSGVPIDGNAQFTPSGKYNKALKLTGGRHVNIPNRDAFDFTARGEIGLLSNDVFDQAIEKSLVS
jgi:hypothetical protein